jgi:actin related protein 2/3 complex subunit 1A/1B
MSTPTQKPKDLFLLEGISHLCFNKDYTQAALSKKDNIIYIYSVKDLLKTDTWKLLHKLESHYQYISGLDWCPETNRILSCSYDKTSFVWDLIDGKWVPSNVVWTTKLGYLCCKWNKRGDKFCEGTSARHLLIGYYNKKTNWWMCKAIKVPKKKDENAQEETKKESKKEKEETKKESKKEKEETQNPHKSSVVACEIDPSSLYVISGSTDLRVYVSSCYIPKIDDQFLTEEQKAATVPFGQVIYEFKENSWINSVTWLPSGDRGVVAGQDAVILVLNPKEEKDKQTEIIKCKHSPATMIIPKDDNSFYAICYDRNIIEYEKKEDTWEIKKTITAKKEGTDNKAKTTIGGSVSAALQKFQKMGEIKKENLAVTTKQASHLHKSVISSCNIKGNEMITTDLSGFVKYWKL